MRLIILVWVVLLAVVVGGVIWHRQEMHRLANQDWDNCVAAPIDPDRAIAGCSPIIQNGSLTQEIRAIANANRSVAYSKIRNYDRAVADGSEAIRLNPGLSWAYIARSTAYTSKEDFDHAVADASEAIRLTPTNATLYSFRAGVYLIKSDFERAIADVSEAIRLAPGNAAFHADRARLYTMRGDYDRAIADADAAVQLDPRNGAAYLNRGLSHLYTAEPAKAFADFTQANRLAPQVAYPALWADIASQRAHLPSQLPSMISQIDMTVWPAPVIRLFLGQSSPADARAAPDRSNREQVCEANFFVGEAAIRAEGAKDVAIRLFRSALSECPRTFLYREVAIAELRSLGEVP